jgi:hypothetical protein
MINQANQETGGGVEPRGDANSADQLMSSGQIKNVAVAHEALQPVPLERAAIPSTPKAMHIAGARALEAYVERRRKLAARIRMENPACTEEEIEARLEQFGA